MAVEIRKANISTISISGNKKNVRAKFVEIKQLADRYGGNILREHEFVDGFFLEVCFEDESLMKIWENSIGIK